MRIWNSELTAFLYNHYIDFFGTYAVLTQTLSTIHVCMEHVAARCHSAQHTHAHVGFIDRKMLLCYWPPVDGDISILLYDWGPTAGLSDTQESEKVGSGRVSDECVGKRVLYVCMFMCMHKQRCVFVPATNCLVLLGAH